MTVVSLWYPTVNLHQCSTGALHADSSTGYHILTVAQEHHLLTVAHEHYTPTAAQEHLIVSY